MIKTPQNSARPLALQLLRVCSAQDKAAAVRQLLTQEMPLDPTLLIEEKTGIPGRPEQLVLVHISQLKQRAVGTREGRAALVHSLAHIEANAINLALDVIWRFEGMPDSFYRDWIQVATEEALHFQLLDTHLNEMGFQYGDFPAHDGLWEMAEKTKGDLLARLALVPRTLEARGLDATPAVKNRLVSVGDRKGAQILDLILRDEIGHVAIGNHWYRYLCNERGIHPIATYAHLAKTYGALKLRGPFNLEARRAAGFDEAELALLGA